MRKSYVIIAALAAAIPVMAQSSSGCAGLAKAPASTPVSTKQDPNRAGLEVAVASPALAASKVAFEKNVAVALSQGTARREETARLIAAEINGAKVQAARAKLSAELAKPESVAAVQARKAAFERDLQCSGN